jgi:4-amino-4-deoxy-L-arabinose transferase-like glycosyltransferase
MVVAKKYWPFAVLFICGLLLVWGIDSIPIILWDESLYSTNAIEMLHSGLWKIHLYDGEIDYYNLKPPFFTQLRALSFHLFGYNYWVHRLPSAIFSCLTLGLLYAATSYFIKNRRWALLAAVFLTIAPGYNTLHVSKGGEYDAMLVFFMLAYVICFLKALSTDVFKWKLYTILFMGLAFYTKSIAGLFFMPGMLVVILYYKREWFAQKSSWYLLGLLLLFPVAYFGYLYATVPGYLESIYQHHFTRFGNTLNDDPLPWYHYLKSPSVLPYYLPGWVLTIWLRWRNVSLAKWVYQSQIIVALFLALISSSATKHGFYTATIFPLSSMVLAYLVYKTALLMQGAALKKAVALGAVLFSVLTMHFTFAKANHYIRYYNRGFPIDYTKQLLSGNVLMKPDSMEVNLGEDPRIYYNETRNWFEETQPTQLKIFAKDLHVPNSEGYNPLLMFYVDYWRLEKGMDVNLVTDIQQIGLGDVVLCSEPKKLEVLSNTFELELLKSSEHCYLYRVS